MLKWEPFQADLFSNLRSLSIGYLIFSFVWQNRPLARSWAHRHEHLAATRAKPSPDLQNQRLMRCFLKPCAKTTNAISKRFHNSLPCLHILSYENIWLLLSCPLCCPHLQVKNVYQTSFLAFLDSMDLSRSTDFPQVSACSQSTCSTV